MRNNFTIIFFLFCFCVQGFAQTDSITKLSFANFLQLVKQHHPLSKQAELISKTANANGINAKGGFDPKLFYDFKNKFYDGKNYYALSNGGFTIPTWFGLDVKAGFEQNTGSYLNAENSVPAQGLIYTQISMPLLQGLIIDERRAALTQARLFKELSEFEKVNALNELLYKAGKAYWDWYLAFANLKVYENAVALSQTRFNAMKRTFQLGDRPAIDTVEAKIQLQDRLINLQQANLDYITKSLMLSNFLWLPNDVPVELNSRTIPALEAEKNNLLNINLSQVDSLLKSHPSLRVYDYKIKQLKVEERFKKEKLKPNLNVNFNPLFDADNINLAYQNNYKWGLSFAFPLFLRKERGDLQLTKIKIKHTQYETNNKQLELVNKTKVSINEFNNYKLQRDIYAKNVNNYETLWDSERKLFDRGESSLFMINARESSFINAQIKLNEIVNKHSKAALEAEYAFGVLSGLY